MIRKLRRIKKKCATGSFEKSLEHGKHARSKKSKDSEIEFNCGKLVSNFPESLDVNPSTATGLVSDSGLTTTIDSHMIQDLPTCTPQCTESIYSSAVYYEEEVDSGYIKINAALLKSNSIGGLQGQRDPENLLSAVQISSTGPVLESEPSTLEIGEAGVIKVINQTDNSEVLDGVIKSLGA